MGREKETEVICSTRRSPASVVPSFAVFILKETRAEQS